jgi:hypothetical protein
MICRSIVFQRVGADDRSVAIAATVRSVGYRPRGLSHEAIGRIGFRYGRGRCGRCGRFCPRLFWRGKSLDRGDVDGTGPCPSLPPEADLDADLTQEGRRPTQPPRQRPGTLTPLSPTTSPRAPRRSEAFPVHTVRVAMTARTAAAIGSASITPSTASSRLPEYADQKVPAGHSAPSQAVARSASPAASQEVA